MVLLKEINDFTSISTRNWTSAWRKTSKRHSNIRVNCDVSTVYDMLPCNKILFKHEVPHWGVPKIFRKERGHIIVKLHQIISIRNETRLAKRRPW